MSTMNPHATTQSGGDWRFRLFFAGVVFAAVMAFGFTPMHATDPAVWLLALVLALMLISEASPVPLPSGGYVTATAVIDLPCLVFLGPFYTAALDLISTLIMQGVVHRRPPIRVIFNMALFSITSFAAGYAYLLMGGHLGHFSVERDLAALIVSGLVYFLVNSALVATVVGLTSGPSPWRAWQQGFQQGLLLYLSSIALGALAAMTSESAGWRGLLLFAVPFLSAGYSFRLYMEMRSDLKDFVRALAEVLEEVDPYTRQHSLRVSQYSVTLARGMGLAEREVEEIEYAALVHDLGKIGPQHQLIVQKPGRLSDNEHRVLQTHAAVGADIVMRVRALQRAAELVRAHHEQPDGRGYPNRLHAPEVPRGAHIIHVADSFDAMTSDRPYRRALPMSEALAEIERNCGTQFDANVVKTLMRLHESGEFRLLSSPTSDELRLIVTSPESVSIVPVVAPVPEAA
jgi:putative nucleotidyltransferase with HDIG domain